MYNEELTNEINQLVKTYFNASVRHIKSLGGGFYGRVFLAEIDKEPYRAVLKLYLLPGIAENEALQLKTLSKYGLVKMPDVYFVKTNIEHTEDRVHEAIGMEYLDGVNAGTIAGLSESQQTVIGEEIVDNLLAYHSVVNERGFGKLDEDSFVSDWRDYYRPIAIDTFNKAIQLYKNGALDKNTFHIIEKAMFLFDRIFYLPITEARLIHGDYNTWNVLLTNDAKHVKAVIDPFNCCWADSEFDIYQLDNANGKDFGLTALYFSKTKASENFVQKNAFYQVFTELNHFYDAKVSIENSCIPAQAKLLESYIKRLEKQP